MAPVLRWLPVTFFLLAPLGLVGLVLAARRWRDCWPLYAAVLSALASLSLFLVLGRLRLVLLAAVVPFAALAIVTIAKAAWGRRALTIAAVVLLGLWTGRALPDDRPLIETTDHLLPFLVDYKDDVKQAMDAGDLGRAAAGYLAFLQYQPDFTTLDHDGPVLARPADRDVALTFARIHRASAELLRGVGRTLEADLEIQKANGLFALAGASPQ
jgi:hypothetical protein